MSGYDEPDSLDEIIDCAAAAEAAIQQLCRLTIMRPRLTPADVDIVLAHLAAAVGALPQAASQLSDILQHASNERVLEMDDLTDTHDPDLAVETARLHLDHARDQAIDLYRFLDAAHNQTAHIAIVDRRIDDQSAAPTFHVLSRRPEDREPPPMTPMGDRQGPRR